jgi:high-affinity Fe2+/Pb2+ permease
MAPRELEMLISGNISQTKFNLITVVWLTFLTALTGWWMWHDYQGVKERNEKLMQIYNQSLEQHKRYEVILNMEERRLGITNGQGNRSPQE